MNNIVLKQISNPGVSFTKDANKKLIGISDLLLENQNIEINYQEFQNKVIETGLFSGSYIRSFIPFLYNAGIINDYTKKIVFNNFFTDLGNAYIKLIKTIDSVHNDNSSNTNLVLLEQIKSDLVVRCLLHMIKTNYKFVDKYCNILIYLKEFKTINREEFYIMQFCIENSINISDYISKYRNYPTEFKISLLDNNDEIVENNNAYNYFIALLLSEQCNLIVKVDQSNCKLNESRIDIIDSIINEYELRGEYNE